jgi:hypothetical protein
MIDGLGNETVAMSGGIYMPVIRLVRMANDPEIQRTRKILMSILDCWLVRIRWTRRPIICSEHLSFSLFQSAFMGSGICSVFIFSAVFPSRTHRAVAYGILFIISIHFYALDSSPIINPM